MAAVENSPRQRKSLKQSLKDFLRLIPGLSDRAQTVGSGILRRADPAVVYLPRFSTVSLFPDFGSSQFDIQQYPVSTPSWAPTQSHTRHGAQGPLLPATSLSQFNLRDAYLQRAASPRQLVYQSAGASHGLGISRQASIASMTSSSLHRSVSTLMIRPSTATSLTTLSTLSQETIRTAYPRSDASGYTQPRFVPSKDRHVSPTRQSQDRDISTRHRRTARDSLNLVELFKSFCVLDTAVAGSPVTATSTELRYIFEIGEQFFLNNHECQEASMDIVTGTDAAGNPVTHLVLFSPLVAPGSGRSRFMLACLVDVTDFIHETAAMPILDPISEGEDSVIDDVTTPPPVPTRKSPWDESHELSAEDLLGGCFISDMRTSSSSRNRLHEPALNYITPKRRQLEREPSDIWLALAATEGKVRRCTSKQHESKRRTKRPSTPTTTSSRSTSNSVDDVLEQFVTSLQSLYSDFFLLGKSPLDDSVYEICNVSPRVYASKEFVEGHLSKTPRAAIVELSARLAEDNAFSRPVFWGTRGEPKQLYCSPLYGQSSLTWICFLVDQHMPLLW